MNVLLVQAKHKNKILATLHNCILDKMEVFNHLENILDDLYYTPTTG